MKQVHLVRNKMLRLLQNLTVYVQCLPEREEEALRRLSGKERVNTYERIADFVLTQLGHELPVDAGTSQSETRRAAGKHVGVQVHRKPGRPPKIQMPVIIQSDVK